MRKTKRPKKRKKRLRNRLATNPLKGSASDRIGCAETAMARLRRQAADFDLEGFSDAVDAALAGETLTEEEAGLLRTASEYLKEFEREEQAAEFTDEE